LPSTRQAITHKFEIMNTECYLIVGLYDDGQPGELVIRTSKEGSTLRGVFDTIGILTSNCLQYGVPLEKVVSQMRHMRFEPAGRTNNPKIAQADSIVDYISQWMEQVFLNGASVNGHSSAG
jgi:ribonucleoside-diphosphate reductase alpha chain